MDPDLVESLAHGPGRDLLDALPPYAESAAMAMATRLRAQGHDAALVAAVLTQSRLRARALDKLGPAAAAGLYTADGLEQATRPAVAARHAQRFVDAGVSLVHDLGCGLGADAAAFARAGLQVRAVDADPATAALARANLAAHPGVQVQAGRAEEVPLPARDAGSEGVWLDPARRVSGVADARGRTRRVFSLDEISPSWDVVCERASRVAAAGAKLSPAFPHARRPAGCEAEWVSWDGDVVEAALWWGGCVRSQGRSATVLGRDGTAVTVTEAEAADGEGAPTAAGLDALGPWLLEPDRAVTRAGLAGALVALAGGAELDAGVGYVSSARPLDLPWARRYAIREAMPYSAKGLRAWVRAHDVGTLTLKKRGSALDPDAVRRGLRLRGSSAATLALTRVAGQQAVLVLEPA